MRVLDTISATLLPERVVRFPPFVNVTRTIQEMGALYEANAYKVGLELTHTITCLDQQQIDYAKDNVRRSFAHYIYGEQQTLVGELRIALMKVGCFDKSIEDKLWALQESMV